MVRSSWDVGFFSCRRKINVAVVVLAVPPFM
jgi:hypothetical protein